MKIRNIFKQNFLPFSLGYLLASLIFISMNTYYNKKALKRNNDLQKQINNIQEVMKELKRKRD